MSASVLKLLDIVNMVKNWGVVFVVLVGDVKVEAVLEFWRDIMVWCWVVLVRFVGTGGSLP